MGAAWVWPDVLIVAVLLNSLPVLKYSSATKGDTAPPPALICRTAVLGGSDPGGVGVGGGGGEGVGVAVGVGVGVWVGAGGGGVVASPGGAVWALAYAAEAGSLWESASPWASEYGSALAS